MTDSANHLPLWMAILSLSEQATRDWLTGLYNRRYFEETLADHIAAAKRYNRPLSLVLFDIDHFKAINDQHGHQAGDTALKEFSNLLKSTARAADLVCRYGGDEFAVILPETNREQAERFIQRVTSQQNRPTVCAGSAALPSNNLIAAADADLLTKKEKFRQAPNQPPEQPD